MEILIWNKQDEVNGVSAEQVLESTPVLKTGEVILVKKSGMITNIESVPVLKVVLNLPEDSTIEDVISGYESYIQNVEQQQVDAVEENRLLKEQLKSMQEALDFLLMGGM